MNSIKHVVSKSLKKVSSTGSAIVLEKDSCDTWICSQRPDASIASAKQKGGDSAARYKKCEKRAI